MLNKGGNLKQHIKETESKASRIIREVNGILSKQNVGQEEIRVKIILILPAILYGFEAWEKTLKVRCKQQKNAKSVIKENTTATSHKTFHWIANGNWYMASKAENRILNSDVNQQYN